MPSHKEDWTVGDSVKVGDWSDKEWSVPFKIYKKRRAIRRDVLKVCPSQSIYPQSWQVEWMLCHRLVHSWLQIRA